MFSTRQGVDTEKGLATQLVIYHSKYHILFLELNSEHNH